MLRKCFLIFVWRVWGDRALRERKLKENDELYVVVRSEGRQQKGIAIRRKKLARLLWTLRGMRKETQQETQRDRLLMRWGAAKAKAGGAAAMVKVRLPKPNEEPSAKTFSFALKKEKLKGRVSKVGLKRNVMKRLTG